MSTIDLESVRSYYKGLSDEELHIRLISNVKGLRPEVIGVIEEELQERGIHTQTANAIIEAVKAQSKVWSDQELEVYSSWLRNMACPLCGSGASRLNGTVAFSIWSFVIGMKIEERVFIACPSCLDKKSDGAFWTSLIMGWWGFVGLFKTPAFIYNNWKMKKQHHQETSNDALRAYILEHIGPLEMCRQHSEGVGIWRLPE